jgi:type VI secretion system protein ImpK
MTLLKLCEPIFEEVCLLNRIARTGHDYSQFEALRARILSIFAEVESRSQSDNSLREQFAKVRLPLIFFADSMISESRLPLAGKWHSKRLAYDQDELAGDEKFFDQLEENLRDPSKEATERLEIFHQCIGTGFTGWYRNQPGYISSKMREISLRVNRSLKTGTGEKICPEAYAHLDTRNFIEPPGTRIGGIIILFAGLCLIVVLVEAYLFHAAALNLTGYLSAIRAHG